jgi:hypothetical protein
MRIARDPSKKQLILPQGGGDLRLQQTIFAATICMEVTVRPDSISVSPDDNTGCAEELVEMITHEMLPAYEVDRVLWTADSSMRPTLTQTMTWEGSKRKQRCVISELAVEACL